MKLVRILHKILVNILYVCIVCRFDYQQDFDTFNLTCVERIIFSSKRKRRMTTSYKVIPCEEEK